MPGRHGRKRRRPQRVDCESLSAKRFLMVSGRGEPSQAPQLIQQNQLRPSPAKENEAPTSILAEMLASNLPPQLRGSVETSWPYPWPRTSTIVPLVSSPTSPSFCIGRVSLSLATGASLRDLLSRLLHTELLTSLSLVVPVPFICHGCHLQLSNEENTERIYLPITTSPPPSKWGNGLRPSAVWCIQLVLHCLKQSERGSEVDRHIKKASGERMKLLSNGGAMFENSSTSTGGTGLSSDADGHCGGLAESLGVGLMAGRHENRSLNDEDVTVGGGDDMESEAGDVCVEVWLGGKVVSEEGDPNALPLWSNGNVARLTRLLEVFHPRPMTPRANSNHSLPEAAAVGQTGSIASRIEQFYRDIKLRRLDLCGSNEPEYDTSSIQGLTAELRGYQKRAVQWMLDRETGVVVGEEGHSLHPLWTELSVPCCTPSILYYNQYTGRLTSRCHSSPSLPRGGILADEMGLGKTVEVLTLLMANRAPLSHFPSPSSSGTSGRDDRRYKTPAVSPSSERAASSGVRASSVVQCVCGATGEEDEEEREYVQCERCEVWFHSECVGFESSRHPTFTCVKCLLENPLPSRATLIISPGSILQQWKEEIIKHTSHNALSVVHYVGVKYGFVSPHDIADCDVVLVSYDTLSKELNYAKSHEVSRMLRHRKRYTVPPSPLPAIHWWRVCLDEAQMVESGVTQAAEMCLKLRTSHRWCVTGTPVQKDLYDLYGLVMFLDIQPYREILYYRRALMWPYLAGCPGPLVQLFSTLMWRNNKDDVAHELMLPQQTECIHWLSFGLVEQFFYRKQREICQIDARKVLSRLSDSHTLGSLTHDTVQKVMAPLHSLRRACCHPQMVRRCGFNQKKCLTMPKLLQKMTLQAKVEAREGLRKLIFSFNGSAGLYILQEKWKEALKSYEQAADTWTEYKEKEVECDKLQKIHTLENMAWLVEQGHCCPADLSQQWGQTNTLREMASELRGQLLGRAEGQLRGAAMAVLTCKRAAQDSTRASPPRPRPDMQPSSQEDGEEEEVDVQDGEMSGVDQESTAENSLPSELGCSQIPLWEKEDEDSVIPLVGWVGVAVRWVRERERQDTVNQLVTMVNSALTDSAHFSSGHMLGLQDISSVQYVIFSHFKRLQEARAESLRTLHGLLPPPSLQQVEKAYHCHLAHSKETGELALGVESCQICKAETVLVEYGSQLFSHYTTDGAKRPSMGLEHGEGSRGPHVFERIVRSFLTFLRHRYAPEEVLDSGKSLLTFIEAVKKEYDALRSLWQALGGRMAQYDELRLATCRMRYMSPMEAMAGTTDTSAVHPLHWSVKMEEFKTERILAKNELTKALGQVIYLKNLAKAPASDGDCGSCPICTRVLGREIEEWGMLPCGHPLCTDCVLEMSRQRSGRDSVRLCCPLCRFSFLKSEINTVRSFEPEDTEITGSPWAKMRGVIQTLQTIQRESATAKTLIFSSWIETLNLVSGSLTENGITHTFLRTSKTFQETLSEFKRSEQVNVLLLPLQSGSKGLNIVEATHVILMEPGLNVGAELQAIGRVHRMGQTKPTTVHRLIIRESVEENIHHLLRSSLYQTKYHTRKEGESTLTLRELETLFN